MINCIKKIGIIISILICCTCFYIFCMFLIKIKMLNENKHTVVAEETDEIEKHALSSSKEAIVVISSQPLNRGNTNTSDQHDELESETERNRNNQWFCVTDISVTMYAVSSVNIREQPTIESNIIGKLSYGDEIEVTGNCDNGWYRVVQNGQEAYILENLLSDRKPETVVSSSYKGFIVNNGGVSDVWLLELESNYLKIPENVRNSFEKNGWSLICTTSKLGAKFFSPNLSVQAVTDKATKTIWVEARKAAMTSIWHEMGHYIDWQCGFVSMTSEFGDIWRSEVEIFKTIITTDEKNISSTSEYFAEAYQAFLEHPDLLSTYCPRTYAYVTGYANSLS